MVTTIGIRQLREGVGSFVARAHQGERIIVTDHGEPVAELGPLSSATVALLALVKSGKATWNGARFTPPEASDRIRLSGGPTISEAISEDRDDRLL